MIVAVHNFRVGDRVSISLKKEIRYGVVERTVEPGDRPYRISRVTVRPDRSDTTTIDVDFRQVQRINPVPRR